MDSSSINSLLADQLELGERIQSIIRNYKKDSRGRKSKPGYYKERLTKLELLWDQFFAGESQVQHAVRGMQIEHKYFINDVFTKTKNVLLETKTEFAKNLNPKTGGIKLKSTPSIKKKIKVESISPIKQDIKFESMSPIKGGIELKSNSPIKNVLLEIKTEFTKNLNPKTGDIKLKSTPPIKKKIKVESISPIKQDIKFESMSPIKGGIELKSNSPKKITLNSMFKEQQVLMDRLDIIINEMSAEPQVGLNPVFLPYLIEMKNMHEQLYKDFKDCL
nr:uncharacterized protein LOC108016531 [Drosophila suzukii]XP_036676186.1 uncharacterized protein LOC108016531 [Drosophila suzukii]XP_036676187.1 uncharacterized protein LOC108016531 [Drosophila suzukii]